MTLGSLFDGSGGFPLAGIRCGITPLWASEIEPYPIAVTRHHFAGMEHLGDVTKVNGAEIPPVDVITFGSPCQDMSVAGNREGMKAEERGDDKTTRSGLFYQAIRIIREMREATNGKYPTFAIWENVPGAFSSCKGEDFRCVLEEFTSILQRGGVHVPRPKDGRWLPAGEIVGDGYSVAWRVLDAQYFPGTPQRRKRIYLVADLAGERAGKILFERDGLSGDPEPCEEAREGTADDATGGTGGSDRLKCLNPDDAQSIRQYSADGIFACLNANASGGLNRAGVCYDTSMAFHLQQDPISSETIAPCLSGQDQASIGVASFMGGQGPKAGGLGYAEEVSPTLKAAPSGANTVPDVVYAINDKATRNRGGGSTRNDDGAGNGLGVQDDGAMYTLDTASRHAVCYPETARCLTARHDGSPCADRGPDVVCYVPVGNHCGAYEDSSVSATLQTKYHYGSGGDAAAVVYSSGSHGTLTEGVGTVGTGTRAVHEMVAVYDTTQITSPANYSNPKPGDPCHPLAAQQHPPLAVYDARGNGDGSIAPCVTGDHERRVSDYTAVCVGNGQMCNITMAEVSNTLDCMHDQQAILTNGKPPRRYIVRRLTPLECCRLQGFPDGWGDIPPKASIPADEAVFWENVRRTHALAMGKKYKPCKTEAALVKWYNKLHSDSSEYKMWGNGIALPCAVYVMEGIAAALKGEISA